MSLILTPLLRVPLISPGDDLADILLQGLSDSGVTLLQNDIFVVAQKIVSKSEGRIKALASVTPSERAVQLAADTGKDARLVEIILQESTEVLRTNSNTIISVHNLGFVCSNAGVDQSNVAPLCDIDNGELALLLPKKPDQSAGNIRTKIELITGKKVGVIIIDSHGRPWRKGTVGTCVGISGVPAIIDLRGSNDLFGRPLQDTQVGVADELAAAASLLMGQAAEGCPAIHVRGFPYELRESSLKEILRSKSKDLFR